LLVEDKEKEIQALRKAKANKEEENQALRRQVDEQAMRIKEGVIRALYSPWRQCQEMFFSSSFSSPFSQVYSTASPGATVVT